jgi:hypothetical protein
MKVSNEAVTAYSPSSLFGRAGQAVADEALYKRDQLDIARKYLRNEALPPRAFRVGVEAHVRHQRDQVAPIMGTELFGPKVERAVADVQQIAVCVKIARTGNNRLLGGGERDRSTQPRLGFGDRRPFDDRLALAAVVAVRGVVQDRSGGLLGATLQLAGVVALPSGPGPDLPAEAGDVSDVLAVSSDEALGIAEVGQREHRCLCVAVFSGGAVGRAQLLLRGHVVTSPKMSSRVARIVRRAALLRGNAQPPSSPAS